MRKASVTTGSVAVAAIGSLALGGIALAGNCHHNSHHNGHHNGHHNSDSYDKNSRGGDGVGGNATNNCLNVGVPILSGLGIGGSGEADGASCVANANGTGGTAY
ncbi:MAG TPA: hypothetical protein VIQ30_09710 [Pseudonocardia sp.]|jgi:hypothetical protein